MVETEQEKMGFVCPDWALEHWNQNECTIEKCTDGDFAVVDHSVQVTIYVGKTYEECENWLG